MTYPVIYMHATSLLKQSLEAFHVFAYIKKTLEEISFSVTLMLIQVHQLINFITVRLGAEQHRSQRKDNAVHRDCDRTSTQQPDRSGKNHQSVLFFLQRVHFCTELKRPVSCSTHTPAAYK